MSVRFRSINPNFTDTPPPRPPLPAQRCGNSRRCLLSTGASLLVVILPGLLRQDGRRGFESLLVRLRDSKPPPKDTRGGTISKATVMYLWPHAFGIHSSNLAHASFILVAPFLISSNRIPNNVNHLAGLDGESRSPPLAAASVDAVCPC